MAFYALLFSKSAETNAAMKAACNNTGIRVEACEDIFSANEKVKTHAFSCVIADWVEQPEASFLLKRARESTPNRETMAIAVVDHEPASAEMHDNRLDFLVYRPISDQEAEAVLTKASETMRPASPPQIAEAPREEQDESGAGSESGEHVPPAGFAQEHAAESDHHAAAVTTYEGDEDSGQHSHATGLSAVCAVFFLLAATFFLWKSRDSVGYLSHTREGRVQVLRESVMAFLDKHPMGVAPIPTAGDAARQDPYFSRDPASSKSNAQTPSLGVVATESTLTETRMPLPQASDFPLPVPVFEHQEEAPIRRERAAIPDSMRNSPPIAQPVVVAVNPAQMMPVSAPQPPPAIQQFSEPVAVSEESQRALLVHTVNPVYPPEALAQKLHGSVVLQARVGRDGTVEDLKIVRGNFVLSRAAIAAVKQWRFQPYTLNGHAAATQTVITINFSDPPA